jgi:hypothetical protein
MHPAPLRLAGSAICRAPWDEVRGLLGASYLGAEGERGAVDQGDVLGTLASGCSEAEWLEDFPQLSHEDVSACLAFAAEREKRLPAGSQD